MIFIVRIVLQIHPVKKNLKYSTVIEFFVVQFCNITQKLSANLQFILNGIIKKVEDIGV